MLEKEIFQKKYETTYKQSHPESFLETVSEDDRFAYTDTEILTGKSKKGDFNKFNIAALGNRGNTEISQKKKLTLQVQKFIDVVITSEDIISVFEKIVEQAKSGETKQQQMLLDRVLGKVVEKLEVKTEGNIKYTFDLGEKNIGED